ncbi:hypothetical protein V6N11_025101 [Hibiscus sabdariffa]|uniref:Uncharacterized protein n=1 Tax=Hibiscus sabdariffa TaxID=183260 RepID=A0ABR2QPG5_9ROSI
MPITRPVSLSHSTPSVMSLTTKGEKLGLTERELGILLEHQKGNCKGRRKWDKGQNETVSINESVGLHHIITRGHVSKEMGQRSEVTNGLDDQAKVEGV